ncbi:MAG: HlyD family efflux transporter periplasmic adaptor subunit [Bryobacter sp.]|nr:HlyD family efflux transporter periplasmic adaptor subunit [Bryobacter sp.]
MNGDKPRIGQGNWIYALTFLAVAGLAALAYYAFREYNKPKADTQAVTPAAPRKDAAEASYTGTIRATKTLMVPAPIDGTLEELGVADGEEVFEGQLLARITNTTLDLAKQKATEDLEQARTKQENAESQLIAARLEASRAEADLARVKLEYDAASKAYERQKVLFREGAGARKTYEKAEADFSKLSSEREQLEKNNRSAADRVKNLQDQYEAARTEVNELTQDLEEAEAELLTGEVKAPVSGVLVGHKRNAGDAVTRDVADLFEIAVDLTALEVRVEVPGSLAARLSAGQNTLVQIVEAGEQPLAGKVREVKEGVAVVEFLSPNPAVKPGATAQVRFLLTSVP